MENKIRISSATKKIEVNDNGDCILLPLGDDSFIKAFYKIADDIQNSSKNISSPKNGSASDYMKEIEKIVDIERETKRKIDDLFGEDTCLKVFGDILPSLDLFVEFFEAIMPFFEEYKNARMTKMSKYDAKRTGSAL